MKTAKEISLLTKNMNRPRTGDVFDHRNIKTYSRFVRESEGRQIQIRKRDGSLLLNINADSLSGLDLSGDYEFNYGDFSRRYMKEINLTGANMYECSLENADLSRSTLVNMYLSETDLSRSKLTDANLGGSHIFRSSFRGCKAEGAKFEDSTIEYTVFSGSKMTGSSFRDCTLRDSDLSNCDLEGTDFFNCSVRNSEFNGSNLRYCKGMETLRSAFMASFVNCDLTGVDVEFFYSIDDVFENETGKLEKFFEGCKGVPYDKIRSRKRGKNMFGVL